MRTSAGIGQRFGPGLVWFALAPAAAATAVAGLFVVAVPALFRRRGAPPDAVAAGLDRLGLPHLLYAGYWTGVLVAFALLCVLVAGTVVWRRPREPMAWVVATFLVFVGCANAPAMQAVLWRHPRLGAVASAANLTLVVLLVVLLVCFPDGRPVPRLSAPLAGAAIVLLIGLGWDPQDAEPSDAWFALFMVSILGGLAAQVHRYRRVSSWEARQQTKWVVVAVSIAVLAQVAFPVVTSLPLLSTPGPAALAGDLLSVTGVTGGFAVLVVAIGVAVLRHRLWDVDVVVNRALVYGGLTVGMLALYAAIVVGLERLIRSPGDSGISLVAAAAVAVFFARSRDRLQRGVNRLMYGQRDEPYRVLTELGQQLDATVEPAVALTTIVETVAAALRLPYAALTFDGEQVPGPALSVGTPVEAMITIPLVHHHEPVGALVVAPRSPNEPFNPADRALLENLARQAAAMTAAVRLADELQRAREQRVLALEEERRRLRRDLHDGLGPALAGMSLQAELARDLLRCDPAQSALLLTDLTRQLQASIADIRQLVDDLRPPALDDLGLTGALQSFLTQARSSGLRIELLAPDDLPSLSAAVEVAAYRIVQEAVTNVLRHAGASTCVIELQVQGDTLVVEVDDDGVGLGRSSRRGIGLRSMRERAAELGGTCTVSAPVPVPAPAPGTERGTRVRAELPHATVNGSRR